jgi:hypothetical protein
MDIAETRFFFPYSSFYLCITRNVKLKGYSPCAAGTTNFFSALILKWHLGFQLCPCNLVAISQQAGAQR